MKKIFLILLVSINLFAWEVNTHRAIDREAIDKASNLEAFVSATAIGSENYTNEKFEGYKDYTYVKYILYGEKNGISDLNQTFNDKIEYLDLLEAGSILEDAQWTHLINGGNWNIADMAHGRFLNHFYNPQASGGSAINWAYDDINIYDYTDAMIYFEKGFSEENINERRKYQAKMFVSVGHMMHLLNDMNSLHVSKGV